MVHFKHVKISKGNKHSIEAKQSGIVDKNICSRKKYKIIKQKQKKQITPFKNCSLWFNQQINFAISQERKL